MNYRVVDKEKYYRSGVFRHFTDDCKCSVSMTARIDVIDLVEHSRKTDTKFYINFLYVLSKVMNHPNWFDASYISWLSYDSLNVELPDGFLHFAPIINWGKYREENGRLMMPVSVRLNHAIADGFLVANVYRLLEKEIKGK